MNEIQELEKSYHFDLYRRLPVTLVRGKGAHVWDLDGREYVDFLAGIAVNALGHAHPAMVKAVRDQSERLFHVSNIYYNEPQARLAKLLSNTTGFERVFFCNSGLEANEAAIKLARKAGHNKGKKGRIISFTKAFHGRSIASITMGGEKLQQGFSPLPDGFMTLPFNDPDALRDGINEDTVAVFIEAIQGEGGVNPASGEFMGTLQDLCHEHDVLIICDEIQTGFGRTGKLFGYMHYNIHPDVITVAKALGGGFPIGAVLTSESISGNFVYGDHGTTFGGNPMACAVSLAVVQTILDDNLTGAAAGQGDYLLKRLTALQKDNPHILDVRGKGLMVGIEVDFPCRPVVLNMLKKGYLINCTAEKTIRLLPPLIITEKEIDGLVENLNLALKEEEN